jgi:hypothetical protein
METDPLITPMELKRREPKFGLALQRKHRVVGDFIPHIQIGNRIFYRLSSVEKFLAEKETTQGDGGQGDVFGLSGGPQVAVVVDRGGSGQQSEDLAGDGSFE